MKKLLFFMAFGLAFLAGLHLGKRKIWQKYGTNKAWETEPE